MSDHDVTMRDMLAQTRQLVARSARRWRLLILLESLGLAVAAPLAFLWLVFLVDNLVYLPAWARWTALLAFVLGIAALLRGLVRRWRRALFSEDQVALAMERRTPGGVQNRLINAVQLARDADDDVRRAVVAENLARLREIHVEQAAQARPAVVRIAAAVAVILVGVVFGVVRTTHFTNAARRILLPFVATDPLYQTHLLVEPGNCTASGDVPLTVTIRGRVPGELAVLCNVAGERTTEIVPVEPGAKTVVHTLRGVRRTMTYAIRGGDSTTEWYRIDVPAPAVLARVALTLRYPAYTNLPDRTITTAGGDLEALRGTRAAATFVFDQPADEAVLILQKSARGGSGSAAADPGPEAGRADDTVRRIPLERVSPRQFAGEILFEDVLGYELETRTGRQPAFTSPPYALRELADQPPTCELAGLEQSAEADPDAVLPMRIGVTDDYGIDRVAISCRRLGGSADAPQPDGDATGAAVGPSAEPAWSDLRTWPGESRREIRAAVDVALVAVGAAEGETVEIAVRAVDTDPLKRGAWTVGPVCTVLVGGEGIALQVLYERILRSEAGIKTVIDNQTAALAKTAAWVDKLDTGSGLRWDDERNLAALATAMKEQAAAETAIRAHALRVTREMTPAAGAVRLSMALLADAEMVRATRIIEAVQGRDGPQAKRSTLAESRITQERIIRSLNEVLEQHVQFRRDWELANMVPFVKMLADRQATLRDASTRLANPSGTTSTAADPAAAPAIAAASGRRQAKVAELVGLVQPAVAAAGRRLEATDMAVAQAFLAAATRLADTALASAMAGSATAAAAGDWKEAAAGQARAATMLADIHAALRQAQLDAAQRALAAVRARTTSDLEAQKEIERLRPGSAENVLSLPEDLTIEDIVHMAEADGRQARGAGGAGAAERRPAAEIPDAALQQADTGARQGLEGVSLPRQPGGWASKPGRADTPANAVKPHVQEQFEDLVGRLLDEADAYQQQYDTLTRNMAQNIKESGDVGKQGGMMNSTAAAAFTGNQKPPPTDAGGISRTGRQGGRSHGMVAGDESINRRGRDAVQDGQERVPDQDGSLQERMSDDPQKEQSVGQGGKKVAAENVDWNVKDAGTFDESITKKMGAAGPTERRVERLDKPIDARTADALRDLHATHGQVIERIKAIKKELNNLFLPTEHLDELMAELIGTIEALRERPAPDLFRLQAQTLDRLRNSARMFRAAGSGVQPSLPRTQAVRGKVLDEPARPTHPGYEDAVKTYYELLLVP